MVSIFTRIIKGEIPCHKVAETEDFIAFLDINPMVKGHTLCIPKKEVDYIFDLDDETYIGLNLFAKEVAKAIQKVVPCKRIGTIVFGLEVPHAHVHLIPINEFGDMVLSKKKIKMSSDEMAALAAEIKTMVNA